MRFANLKVDYWELESGEARQAQYGDKFWIPDESIRRHLRVGQLAKLLFQIEAWDEETDTAEVGVERMWVLVTHIGPGYYVGRLVNQPGCASPDDDVYLGIGAEIPFRSEHVIDVHEWPEEEVSDFMANAPFKPWSGAEA
jgi:hypothetical protein